MSVRRFDRGTLGEVERTPQGGLAIPAFLTRVGVFEYEQPDGRVVREYRPPEEVFNTDSIATLPNATLTNDHPANEVDSKNFKEHVVGHVEPGVKQDGDKLTARLIVQDAKTLGDIRVNRKREVSCGYHCDVEETPGTTPTGERYDRVQRNIRYNHVALVDDGRAGPTVRLRLDSAGNANPTSKEKRVDYEVIEGTKYEVGSDPHRAAVQRRDSADKERGQSVAQARKDSTDAKKALATEKARADAAEAKLKETQEALKTASDPQRLDHAVRVRQAVIGHARGVLGQDFKVDGLDNFAVKVAAAKKAFPHLKLDAKQFASPAEHRAYVNGLFRAAITPQTRGDGKPKLGVAVEVPEELRRSPEQVRADGRGGAGARPGERTLADVRRDRMDTDEERHRKPLMVSKNNPHKQTEGFPSLQSSMLETMK